MSSDLTEPSKQFVADLESLIKKKLGKEVAVYTRWIPPKARLPCVTIIEVMAGLIREVGIGQVVDASTKGVYVPVRCQIDVWARSVETARVKADTVFYELWVARGSFGSLLKDLRVSAPIWVHPGGRYSEKTFRQMLTVQAVYAVTKIVS